MSNRFIISSVAALTSIGAAYAAVVSEKTSEKVPSNARITVVRASTDYDSEIATKSSKASTVDIAKIATSSTISPSINKFRQSVAVGNDLSDLTQFQSWLGRDIDAVSLHGGEANWSDWKNSLAWQAGIFRGAASDILWSVPLIPNGATLNGAAIGLYDANYRDVAQQFIRLFPNDQQIYLRIGWEFNGKGWRTWSAVGKSYSYKAAFRRFVKVFRSVSPDRFVFEWTPNVGDVGMDPATAYPGDDVVDVIGMDFYYDTKWLGTDPVKAWNYMVTQKYGLQWHQDFANSHKKMTAYAEWGVNSDTAGPYIQLAKKWFSDHPVLYQNYWNSNADFRGMLSRGQYLRSAAVFKSTFGSIPKAGSIIVTK